MTKLKHKEFFFSKVASSSLMTEKEKHETIGGDHTVDQYLGMFNNSGGNGLTAIPPTEYNYFKTLITELNSTTIGHDMLEGLFNASIPPVSLNFEPGNGADSYDYNTNSLSFSFLGTLPSNMNVDASDSHGLNFDFLAHELFHIYEDHVAYQGGASNSAFIAYENSVRSELDSELFATMAMKLYDNANPFANGLIHQVIDASYYTPSFDQFSMPQQNPYINAQFADAWSKLIDDGHFSINQYNILVNTFVNGANYSSSQINNLTVPFPLETTDATTRFLIKEFYPQYFPDPTTGDSGTWSPTPTSSPKTGIFDAATNTITLTAYDPTFLNLWQSNWLSALYNSAYSIGGGDISYGVSDGYWTVGAGGLLLIWHDNVPQSD